MNESYGVVETKEVLDVLIEAANLGLSVGADHKVDLADAAALFSAVPALIAKGSLAVQNLAKVPMELGEMSAEEGAELVSHVALKLNVGDEKAKNIVVAALKTLVSVAELVGAIVTPPVVSGS